MKKIIAIILAVLALCALTVTAFAASSAEQEAAPASEETTIEARGLESQTFFYIAASGDDKAVGGQDEVMAMLDEDEVPYSYAEGWDAQASAEELSALVEKELSEGNTINVARWETGTVLNGGSGMEHMASFDYAYKLEAVRDWLFEQTK